MSDSNDTRVVLSDVQSLGPDEQVQWCKDWIDNYQETHTELEFSCLVDRIRGVVRGKRKGGAS